jgi:hypothetical protein
LCGSAGSSKNLDGLRQALERWLQVIDRHFLFLTLKMTALLLEIIGLFINLLGTVMLFTQVTGLKVIPTLQGVTSESHTSYDLYKHLTATINDAIKDANERNRIAHEKAIKWIVVVVVGVIVEVVGLILSHVQDTF